MTSRVEQLRALGPQGLERLLRARPDATRTPAPRTLAELADRIDNPISASAAIARLDLPELQVLLALNAFDEPQQPAQLEQLLGADPSARLDALVGLALVQRDASGTYEIVRDVAPIVPDLLGLGPSLRAIADQFPHRVLRVAERALGLPAASSKRETVAALRERYRDGAAVRAALEHVPSGLRALVVAYAWGEVDDEYESRYDPARWDLEELVRQAGVNAGLVIGSADRYLGHAMPAEVALALRGPDYRLPFHPDPPQVATLPVSRLGADTAAAVTAFGAAATAVLDHLAARPAAVLKAGGVGARELTRIGKALGLDPTTVRMIIELAAVLMLLDVGTTLRTSEHFDTWRAGEPVERFAGLAWAWWTFPGRPSRERNELRVARAALMHEPCRRCEDALHGLFAVLRTDSGLSVDGAAALALWHRPSADAGDPPFDDAWHEAGLLGAVAQGALTEVGAALRAQDDAALRAALAPALPASATTASFGSDLSVVVAGSPSARVSAVLDACADRTGSGGAVTWTLSRASVRRALDAGQSVATLREELRGIAGRALPQVVEVLLDDLERTYGAVTVRSASSVVVGRDEAEIALLLADRKLAGLELVRVAPTVLVAGRPDADVVTALRAAGYLPAWTPPADEARVVVARRTVSAVPRQARAADPAELAGALLAAKDGRPSASGIERDLLARCPQLRVDEVHVLAAAVEDGGPVEIVYESGTGTITGRVITPTTLYYGNLIAWCHLRRAEREFLVERIVHVRPAG